MVVLDEDDGGTSVHLFENGIAETPVDVSVSLPIVTRKPGAGVHDVAERPEGTVRQAEVVPVFLLPCQPHPPQRVTRFLRGHCHASPGIDDETVGRPRAMRNPDAARRADDRIQRNHHPAGRLNDANSPRPSRA